MDNVSADLQKEVQLYLRRFTKQQMIQQCLNHGLNIHGKKFDLANRLVLHKAAGERGERGGGDKEKVHRSNSFTATALVREDWKPPVVQIEKNLFGNYEHQETGLVFHQETQKAVGVQQEDGRVRPLRHHDIQQCRRFKFCYDLPLELGENQFVYEILENSDLDEPLDLHELKKFHSPATAPVTTTTPPSPPTIH